MEVMLEVELTAPCYAPGQEFVILKGREGAFTIRGGKTGTIVVRMPREHGEFQRSRSTKASAIYFLNGRSATVIFDDMTVWFLLHTVTNDANVFVLVASAGQNPIDDNAEYPEILTRLYGVLVPNPQSALCTTQAKYDGENLSGGLIVKLRRFR